jgi:ABC transporter substrate binding protein (PQQ-dependent alcohol dehydrogenase system)
MGAAQCVAPAAADPLAVKIGVLRQTHSRETISILDIPAPDDFVAGVKMAIDDDNTTGRFLDQSFSLVDAKLGAGEDPTAKMDRMLAEGVKLFVVDLPPDQLIEVADHAKDALIFNASAADERVREQDCRANVIHTAPSRAMLADGLAQYLIWKQWRRWLLIVGSHPDDKLLGAAYERAAKKFGAKIVETRAFADTGGGRRSDTGYVQVQRQMPVATQNAPAYDVLIAADENNVFAGYLPYRTWDARPVAGSAGLMPTSWDPQSVAEPLLPSVQARHERAGQSGLGRRAHHRRDGRSHQIRRSPSASVLYPRPRFQCRRFQGHTAHPAPLEPAIAAADPAH